MTDSVEFAVIARKKGGGHLQSLGKFPSRDAAIDFSLKVEMTPFDDVWVEPVEQKTSIPIKSGEIKRDSLGLRDALFDEIDLFRQGRGDPQRAVAISKLAGQILAAAKIEHEVAKYRGSDGYSSTPVQLGRNTEAD